MATETSPSRDPTAQDDDEADSPPLAANEAHSRRREQVRRAQRSHRERRANYLRSLEAEVENLRAKDARNTTEIEHFKTVNRRLCTILREHRIPIPSDLDRPGDDSTDDNLHPAGATTTGRSPRRLVSRALRSSGDFARSVRGLVDLSDPQIAVDFVMELEAPCLVAHPHFSGPDGEQGHTMQLRNMIVQAPPSGNIGSSTQQTGVPARNISNDELRDTLLRLLEAARSLNMPGELTPVQCWNALRINPGASRLTKHKFDELKKAFLGGVVCYGFGATVDEVFFRDLEARLLPGS